MRTLDDIRALGGNDAADERRFATAARVSEINLALYRTFAQPIVRALASAPLVDTLHQMHPLRVQYEVFSDANPFMAPVSAIAKEVRKNRRPTASDNHFIAMQENVSKQIVAAFHGGSCGKDLPDRLWLTGPAGRGRDGPLRCAAAAKTGQESALS
jgi:uncharacterized protein DUF3141